MLYSPSDKSFVLGDLTNIQSHDTMYITKKKKEKKNFNIIQGCFFNSKDQI